MKKDDHYVTEKEAAKFLGVAPATLRKQRCIGVAPGSVPLVPYVKLGTHCVRYSTLDLREFMAQHRSEGTAI